MVQRCCLIRVLRQFAVSLVGQIFIERALCYLERSEFNSVFVQIAYFGDCERLFRFIPNTLTSTFSLSL
ncbi:hypothetical protein EXA14_19745, partial [Vibrio cincinnatiensis]|nr:hypothetical protein [Vibrio cincinnatiensis]